mgnify:CR=1 FL=1
MKLSEDTSVSMPIKNMLGIITAVLVGAWFGFGVIERLNIIETELQLITKDLDAANEFIDGVPKGDMVSPPIQELSSCLAAKRLAERNGGNLVQYTCTLEQCEFVTDQTGVKHCDKIIKK